MNNTATTFRLPHVRGALGGDRDNRSSSRGSLDSASYRNPAVPAARLAGQALGPKFLITVDEPLDLSLELRFVVLRIFSAVRSTPQCPHMHTSRIAVRIIITPLRPRVSFFAGARPCKTSPVPVALFPLPLSSNWVVGSTNWHRSPEQSSIRAPWRQAVGSRSRFGLWFLRESR